MLGFLGLEIDQLADLERAENPGTDGRAEGVVEPGVADFIAQAAQFLLHREQGREDFFLSADEEFIPGLTGAGAVQDLIAVLAGLHNGVEVVGISKPGLLLEVEVIDGRKKIDDGDAAVAQPGSVIQT